MADARKFIINSDYPMDMIVFFDHRENLPNASSSPSATIQHNLPFIPLVFGVWSITQDYSDPRSFGQLTDSLDGYVDVRADDTNIYVYSSAGYYDSEYNWHAYPVFVRVYAFEPADSNADVPFTNISAGKFIINSDYNYAKLLRADVVDASTGGGTILVHNLGYKPQVMAWTERAEENKPFVSIYSGGFTLSVLPGMDSIGITAISLNIAYTATTGLKFHTRIYAND
jgi:hypothetical protein